MDVEGFANNVAHPDRGGEGRKSPKFQGDGNELDESGEKPKKSTILVIDDDASIRRLFDRFLRKEHEVHSCESAIEAQQKIQMNFEPDMIFCDIMMPKMTGEQFYRWLEQEKPHLIARFYTITGMNSSEGVDEFIDGMKRKGRFLDKPFRMSEIRRMINELLNSR